MERLELIKQRRCATADVLLQSWRLILICRTCQCHEGCAALSRQTAACVLCVLDMGFWDSNLAIARPWFDVYLLIGLLLHHVTEAPCRRRSGVS
jgi:hypothetical protein